MGRARARQDGCEHCTIYSDDLHRFPDSGSAPGDVGFGKMLLDRGGLVGFQRANPWLADLDVLPYTLVYRQGVKVAEFAGGDVPRLQARLARVRGDAG